MDKKTRIEAIERIIEPLLPHGWFHINPKLCNELATAIEEWHSEELYQELKANGVC